MNSRSSSSASNKGGRVEGEDRPHYRRRGKLNRRHVYNRVPAACPFLPRPLSSPRACLADPLGHLTRNSLPASRGSSGLLVGTCTARLRVGNKKRRGATVLRLHMLVEERNKCYKVRAHSSSIFVRVSLFLARTVTASDPPPPSPQTSAPSCPILQNEAVERVRFFCLFPSRFPRPCFAIGEAHPRPTLNPHRTTPNILVHAKHDAHVTAPPSTQARDAYFACLDNNGARRAVRHLRREYEKACPASWVKHFDKKREEDNKLKRLLETRADAVAATAANAKAA